MLRISKNKIVGGAVLVLTTAVVMSSLVVCGSQPQPKAAASRTIFAEKAVYHPDKQKLNGTVARDGYVFQNASEENSSVSDGPAAMPYWHKNGGIQQDDLTTKQSTQR